MNNQQVTNKAVIDIHNLDYYFGKGELRKQVLFDINLEIDRGEIVLMTGPSGSGKTTLLTLVSGLRSAGCATAQSPQSGSCKILGKELCGASSIELVQARRNNGYIFQAHNLHNSLTASQNVQMGLEVHGKYSKVEMRDRASAMLEEVGLGERIDYYPDELSGGQKQRVAIARALVARPAIVLADEPTAALDSKSGRDVVNIMQKLAREQGSTILLVTHDDRILDVADRIVHMEDGKLINNLVKEVVSRK
ncbi:DevA family ABC transporter ATP-binding protein [Pleurocapsa sp. FMAR1]|uniref:DevA family ABC transporter ATP-binding protein n=1 Tax=Pleurocapsa sp. FMAR1 TaxID=3040204 RepID=UPI0029C8EF0E|nr:DevA family ABC transporter ATP-binding protein [Pleurocapsa sp. FMAR1]